MNTFANLLPSVGGNRPPLSDEELRRLAEMLQMQGDGYGAMGKIVEAPKKIETPQGTNEELIYATQDEIEMLKKAGGADIKTPFGGVRSFPQ